MKNILNNIDLKQIIKDHTTDDQGEQWTVDPMNGTIYHTDGDQPAPLDTLTAIVNAIYDIELSDFTVEE